MSKFAKPADSQFLFARMQAAIKALEAVKMDRKLKSKSVIAIVGVVMDSLNLLQYPAF